MHIPETYKNCDVVVALAIPMPAPGNAGLTFPLIEGQILELYETSFIIRNKQGEELIIPHGRVQHVSKSSKIARVPGLIVPMR